MRDIFSLPILELTPYCTLQPCMKNYAPKCCWLRMTTPNSVALHFTLNASEIAKLQVLQHAPKGFTRSAHPYHAHLSPLLPPVQGTRKAYLHFPAGQGPQSTMAESGGITHSPISQRCSLNSASGAAAPCNETCQLSGRETGTWSCTLLECDDSEAARYLAQVKY